MTEALILGVGGKMGTVVAEMMSEDDTIRPACGVDPEGGENAAFPVFHSFDGVNRGVDVVVDFSSPSALEGEMAFALSRGIPVVIGTTGHTSEQTSYIEECSKKIPVFKTANFSLGVNLMCRLVREAAETLGDDFDIEIIEKHHNKKADAPSGTAKMLAESANSAFGGKKECLYGREGAMGRRGDEIGIHAVRGGTIVGEHEVMFCGDDEIITLSHSARSKRVFAAGAVRAAKWIVGRKPGMYGMDDILEGM